MEHTTVFTNGINLHVVQAGPEDGPLVILLHGFPEFWYGWRQQIDFLVDAGYRVWAPDQRGYNLSDKPAGVAAYNIDTLADDIVGLIDAAGRKQAFVVGHDWGGAVTWRLGERYPERITRMVILNVPNGSVLMQNLRRNFSQLLKSWYVFFFQIPRLPEAIIRRNNYAIAARSLTDTSRRGTFSDDDLVRYREAWARPNAFRSMMNWYRAIIRNPPKATASSRIRVPTLLIWGARDAFLGREMAQPSVAMCDDGQLVFIEKATHWVQHEEPERVNNLLASFLRDGSVG